jgi:hypothetical protein
MQTAVAIFISGKIDSELNFLRRDKEYHFILRKGTISKEEITINNTYAPNVSASNFIIQTLVNIKTQTDPKTMIYR